MRYYVSTEEGSSTFTFEISEEQYNQIKTEINKQTFPKEPFKFNKIDIPEFDEEKYWIDKLSKGTGWGKEYCKKVIDCDPDFLPNMSAPELQNILRKLSKIPLNSSARIFEYVLPKLVAITF